ncbi:reverse transcriptase [Tanacetum coccineum]
MLRQISDKVYGLCLFKDFATAEFAKINAGEGTSNQGGNGGNNMTNFHPHQGGGNNNAQHHHNPYGKLTRLDFLKFNGEDVKGWIFRVHQFFVIDQVREDQKLRLVSMHLFDKALNSHLQFIKKFRENVPWNVYETEILSRFGEVYDDPIIELKNLKQTTDVQSYQDKFEMLLNKVDLFESHVVNMFMGGLKGEIRVPLRMFKPVTIKDVSCLAKMQEATVALTKAKPRYSSYSSSRFQQSNVTPRTTTYPPKPPLLALPLAPRPDMCHKCSGQLYALEVVANVAEGVNDFKTMRIKGYMGRQLVHILMDTGSTHNILAIAAAIKMRCQLRRTVPLEVSIANGNQMVSEYMCKGFEWTIQGITYKTDVMIIPLGSYDMVLGVQWLATLGDIFVEI